MLKIETLAKSLVEKIKAKYIIRAWWGGDKPIKGWRK
jgi:hypothetical protein